MATGAGTYTYTYDNVGNITSVSDGTYTTSYEYDSLGQLVRENDQKANTTYTYTYVNGNITSKNYYAYTTGELGAVQDTETWTYSNGEWADLLTKWGDKNITYDAIGNPIVFDDLTMTWQGRQLETLSMGSMSFAYDYNTDGQRISKTFTDSESGDTYTTEYFYNGSILAGERTGNNTIVYMYDNNGDLFGFTYNGTEYYYVKNAQNDVTAVADSQGNILVRYYYNAWGSIIDTVDMSSNGIGDINPIRYRSYYYDADTSLYYLNSRYYLAEMCRFLNVDAVVSGIGDNPLGYNMFAYCFNNPVNMSDEDGNWPKWVKKSTNWINQNILRPIKNFFNPNTNTIGGQFQDGILKGSGSLTAGYNETNIRFQINAKDSSSNGMCGVYSKTSIGNASGKIGIGNAATTLSLKGVADVLSATAQAGFQYKDGIGLATKAKASVLSGRVTTELELAGWQIEFGVSGDFLSVGAEAMIGVFPNEGFTAKASVGAGLFGAGFVFRVKPAQ